MVSLERAVGSLGWRTRAEVELIKSYEHNCRFWFRATRLSGDAIERDAPDIGLDGPPSHRGQYRLSYDRQESSHGIEPAESALLGQCIFVSTYCGVQLRHLSGSAQTTRAPGTSQAHGTHGLYNSGQPALQGAIGAVISRDILTSLTCQITIIIVQNFPKLKLFTQRYDNAFFKAQRTSEIMHLL